MIIIDTAILIDYLREYPKAVYFLDNEYFVKQTKPHISAITAMEIIDGAKDKTDQEILISWLKKFRLIEISKKISQKAFAIKTSYNLTHHISLADALIAATALEHKAQLFTRNLKDFDFIPEIKVKSPY